MHFCHICVYCLQVEASVGDEYSKIQCDNIPPNRHDIQVFDEFIIPIYIYLYMYTRECSSNTYIDLIHFLK